MDLNEKSTLFMNALFELIDTQPPTISHNLTWESLTFPEGYEKPPKEAFEKRYQELIDAFPMQQVRETRNRILDQTDKYSAGDYPHKTDELKQAWLDYRQTLRDLPSVTEDPKNPVWPVPPE